MKTATIRDLRNDFARLSKWLDKGETIEIIKRGKHGSSNKRVIFALVERGGETRMMHLQEATAATVREVLVRNVDRTSALHTDESKLYTDRKSVV